MDKSSKEYIKACDAIRDVYRKGDSEELLALRYLAGSLANDLTEKERARTYKEKLKKGSEQMKIAIVRETTKRGDRYYAYKTGLFSHLGIFCFFNRILLACGTTPEECIKEAKMAIVPDPPPNRKLIDIVKI